MSDKDGSNVSVKWRTPDITLGLGTYYNEALEHDCGGTCELGTRLPGIHWSLSKERLRKQMYSRKCGLVVDPKWGHVDLIFPWVVYEAKRRSTSYEQAESQIYHAAQIYLAMLDDLARDPSCPEKCQSNESVKCQIFCFTSSGPSWVVYVAFNFLGSCVGSSFSNCSVSIR